MIKLEELRKKSNLSQTELGKILNLSQKAISRYENGTAEPDLQTLKKIANFFNVSIDYLLDYKEEEKKIYFTSEEVKKIIDVITILNNKIGK